MREVREGKGATERRFTLYFHGLTGERCVRVKKRNIFIYIYFIWLPEKMVRDVLV